MEKNTDFQNIRGGDHSQIAGWGVDADPGNDPTRPMKKRTNEEHKGYTWKRPILQPVEVEVLHSIERPDVTAVFGTSVPPSGVSGMIRRFAFRYSESSYGHWLPLLLADRVGIAEGLLGDFLHFRIPNIFVEKGGKAQWKYDRARLVRRIAVGLTVAGAAVLFLGGKRKR